jgi:hypothetical protein
LYFKDPWHVQVFESEKVQKLADLKRRELEASMDAKATVKIGLFSRGGKNRVETAACDHDFQPQSSITPQGIFLPQFDELFLYLNTSNKMLKYRKKVAMLAVLPSPPILKKTTSNLMYLIPLTGTREKCYNCGLIFLPLKTFL